MISVGLFLVYLVMTLVGKGPKRKKFQTKVLDNKIFQLISIGLIAMPALNSIGVLSTSQLLLAKNFKLVDEKNPTNPLPPDLAISTSFFHNAMNVNLDAHIVPGLLGICVLLCLGLGRQSPRPWRWNLGVGSFIILLNILLAFIWMAVPVQDEKTGKDYRWVAKLEYVYDNPDGSLFIAQFAMVIVLSFVVAFKIA
jgi:hypothetical protein